MLVFLILLISRKTTESTLWGESATSGSEADCFCQSSLCLNILFLYPLPIISLLFFLLLFGVFPLSTLPVIESTKHTFLVFLCSFEFLDIKNVVQ